MRPTSTAGGRPPARAPARTQAASSSGELVDFDYEVTLLTVRHADGTTFCPPVGHRQVDGDYRESWQPHPMSDAALADAQEMARAVTDGLGGHGIHDDA